MFANGLVSGRYCYFTGSLDAPEDVIPRSHSASSVEEFLSGSPSLSYMLAPSDAPARSPSFDDVVGIGSGSGSATPTPTSASFDAAAGLERASTLVAH